MSPKAIILLTVFIDVLGIGLIIPTLPFYVESFGVGHIVVTALFSVFSFFSFISAPYLGALSDKIGRRPVLIVSLLSTAIGWLIFAAARNPIWLFVGRMIDGLAAGNISTAQNYLIDISKDPKERTHNLGLIGAVFGIGFIVGPMLGGFLATVNPTLPFWVVGILASINTINAFFNLPETHHHREDKKVSINPLQPISKALKDKRIRPLYLAWFLVGIAISATQSIFSLYVDARFNWKAFSAGVLMAFVGVIISFNQAFGLKRIWLKYFSESDLTKNVLLTFAIGYWVMCFDSKYIFMFGLIITAFGQSIFKVVMSSQTVGIIDKKDQGEVMGVLASLMSFSMIIAPMFGGYLFGFSVSYPYIFSGVILFIAYIVVKRFYRRGTVAF